MTEAALQQQQVVWFNNSLPEHRGRLFAVNNNSINSVKGRSMKAQGVRAGVSDLIFLGSRSVLFIENKTATGRQQKCQKEFEEVVNKFGHCEYHICRSLDQFKELIIKNI